jgi:hypothetical protein
MHLTNACGPQQVRDGPLVRGDQRRGRTAAAAKAICDEVEDDVGVVHPRFERRSVAWSEHKDARLGAALAYYSVFSLGPGSSSRRSRCLLPDEVPYADGTSRPAAYMAE